MRKRSFEDIMRQKSEGFEKQAPPGLWNKLREQIGSSEGSNRPYFVLFIAAAALISAGIWMLLEPGNKKPESTGQWTKPDAKTDPGSGVVQEMDSLRSKTGYSRTDSPEEINSKTSAAENKSADESTPVSNSHSGTAFDRGVAQNKKTQNSLSENPPGPVKSEREAGIGPQRKDTIKIEIADQTQNELRQPETIASTTKDSFDNVQSGDSIRKQPITDDTKTGDPIQNTNGGRKRNREHNDDKNSGLFGMEFVLGRTFSLNKGFDYVVANSNSFRYPPLSASYDPMSAQVSDYKAFREATDENTAFTSFGLNCNFRVHRLVLVRTGVNWFSLGRKLTGGDDFYYGTYSSSTEGDIRVDSGTMMPLIESENTNYFTPFGNSYVVQRYRYVSIPIRADFQFFQNEKISMGAGIGVEYNRYRKTGDLYYFDYNNYRYIKLSDVYKEKYLRKSYLSFSPGLSLQYHITNTLQVSWYAQYSFFRNSIYTDNSYLNEYYNAFHSGFGLGFRFPGKRR